MSAQSYSIGGGSSCNTMSPSPESLCISCPLQVIASLYSKHSKSASAGSHDEFFCSVRQHFSTALVGHLNRIPRLENTATRGLLVRFRCMVQDTGLANEVYILDVEPKTSDGNDTDGRGCTAYSEGAVSGSPIIGFEPDDYSLLHERQIAYCTSVPGETDWLKARYRRTESGDSLAEDVQRSLSMTTMVPLSTNSLTYKHPIPEERHAGAIVKLYPGSLNQTAVSDTLRATEIVEFIGVLDYSVYSALTAVAVEGGLESAESTLPEQTKTLHAIYCLPHADAPDIDELPLLEVLDIRQQAIKYIAAALDGDAEAAEWLLLSLVGRIHARRAALALGQLPINLVLSSSASDDLVQKLHLALSSITARLVLLDFSIPSLNSSRYAPSSQNEDLHSGRLQLPAGTCVLVDETRLGEGTLKDAGVRNVQDLTNAIHHQTLEYQFPFSAFSFETDLNIVVISRGKSLLPIECVVHVVPNSEAVQTDAADLSAIRHLLAKATSAVFSIPADVSEHIQSDFVRTRQADAKCVNEQDLLRRMSVARLLAKSYGQAELSEDIWHKTVKLDEARLRRMKA